MREQNESTKKASSR